MSSLTITGKLHSATNAEQKGDNFTVRQFTLELTESGANGQVFTNYAGFQLTNDKCALLNNFHQGQLVTVHFNIRGSLWQGKTITNLQAWKIEAVATQQPAQAPQPQYQPPQAPPAQQWQQPAAQPQPQQWQQQPAQAPPQQQPQQWGQPQQAPQPAQPQQWGQPAPQNNDLPF